MSRERALPDAGLRIGRGPTADTPDTPWVSFTFEGQEVRGRPGESMAAALHAAGVRIFSRSFKYHRPRGLSCMAGACPSCAMRVDGSPGVPTCITPLRGGETVEREHAWPNADHDVLALLDLLAPLAPAGFQYRRFRRSPRAFARFERILARLAGHGRLPDAATARSWVARGTIRRRPEVAVVGGGPAGMSAALAAAEAGARVVLLERDHRLGGNLLNERDGGTQVAELEQAIRSRPAIEILTACDVLAWYDDDILLAARREALYELLPDRVVLATGTDERPLPFLDNDLPGVMLANGARRLVHRDGVLPGRVAVVVTDEDAGYDVAIELAAVGIRIAALVDARPPEVAAAAAHRVDLAMTGAELLAAHTIEAALGRGRVRGATLAPVPATHAGRDARRIECDTICVSVGRRPARELLLQRLADGKTSLDVAADLDLDAPRPAGSPLVPGLWVAGGLGGTSSLAAARAGGQEAGRAAALQRS